MEGEMCLVERDGAAFYAPMEQASAWSEQGYAVYEMRQVPLNDAARADRRETAPARGMGRRPKAPEAKEIA